MENVVQFTRSGLNALAVPTIATGEVQEPTKALDPLGATLALQGIWVAVDARVSGDAALKIHGQQLIFKGDRFRICKDGALLYGGTFKVGQSDEAQVVDFRQSETEQLRGLWQGVYRLEGDDLYICDNAPDQTKPRPADIEDRDETGYVWVHFVRVA